MLYKSGRSKRIAFFWTKAACRSHDPNSWRGSNRISEFLPFRVGLVRDSNGRSSEEPNRRGPMTAQATEHEFLLNDLCLTLATFTATISSSFDSFNARRLPPFLMVVVRFMHAPLARESAVNYLTATTRTTTAAAARNGEAGVKVIVSYQEVVRHRFIALPTV